MGADGEERQSFEIVVCCAGSAVKDDQRHRGGILGETAVEGVPGLAGYVVRFDMEGDLAGGRG